CTIEIPLGASKGQALASVVGSNFQNWHIKQQVTAQDHAGANVTQPEEARCIGANIDQALCAINCDVGDTADKTVGQGHTQPASAVVHGAINCHFIGCADIDH